MGIGALLAKMADFGGIRGRAIRLMHSQLCLTFKLESAHSWRLHQIVIGKLPMQIWGFP
jgi:hypothetical protein